MQFDAVLLLSFGGPEGPEQVRPFLENVTRGRGVPAERLDAVAEHYLHFGGVSPINGINRTLIAELEAQQELPVYFGNRNWEPYVEDAVTAMRDNGVRRAAVFATSAWSGYSSCTQYVEDIARARRAAGRDAPELVKLRPYFDHPLFVEMFADAITAAAATVRGDARLVFTAHSIPTAADRRCGPNLYSRQVAYATRLVAAAAGYCDFDLAWQSRSGPPQVPLAGARRYRPAHRSGWGRHQRGDRVSHWIRRRPYRGGVGSRPRVAITSRGSGHRVRPGQHPQCRPAVRSTSQRFDRRTPLRPYTCAGEWPRSGAGLSVQHQRPAMPSAALRG